MTIISEGSTLTLSRLVLIAIFSLSGCQVSLPTPMPSSGSPAQTTGVTAATWTLPFATVVEDGGQGRFTAAGTPVTRVIRAQAEWDAFVQSLPPAVLPKGAMPSQIELPPIDFAARQLVVFLDGAPPLAATSRIVAIEDHAATLVVRTQRWEPPPNPNAGPDLNARLHVVAIARSAKQVEFAPLVLSDGAAREGEGGYSAAGSPMMHPRWRAVPNPDVTQAMVEEMVRGQFERSAVTRFVVEKRTIAEASALLNRDDLVGNFTPESEVWVVIVEGDLAGGGIAAGGRVGGGFGGTPGTFSSVTSLVDIETGRTFASMAQPGKPGKPGMQLTLPQKSAWYVGDMLTVTVAGPLLEGEAVLSLTGDAPEQRWSRPIPFKEMAAFALRLDASQVPWLGDADVQKVNVELKFATGGTSFEMLLMRDRDAAPTPQWRSASGDSWRPGEAPPPPPTDAELESWVRAIAEQDWKGTGVQMTHAPVQLASLGLEPHRAAAVPEGVKLRQFEVRGTFPKVLIPAIWSGTNRPTVMAPRRLAIVVMEHFSKEVVQLKAFAE